MNKDELLSLLDDADVRKKVLAVVNQQADDVQEPIPEAIKVESQRADRLLAEVDPWKQKFDDERQRAKILQAELKAEGKRADKLQREVDAWKEKFNAERRRADKLKIDGDAWIKQYEHQQRRANELQGKLETWIKKFN
ncbi:MAG: hypothetical protein IJQ01_08205, partial [Selenomonadaceae bacterium]|nr:hypothetical protein [Selenomonadaceae bacterium]